MIVPVEPTAASAFVHTEELSDDYRIDHIVELLKYITNKYRDRKSQEHFYRFSLCHVCFHEIFFPPI